MKLNFGYKILKKMNGQPFDKSLSYEIEAYSDASSNGYGGYMYMVNMNDTDTIGRWSPGEVNTSSSWREAEAISRVLQENSNKMAGKTIKWFCDNKKCDLHIE